VTYVKYKKTVYILIYRFGCSPAVKSILVHFVIKDNTFFSMLPTNFCLLTTVMAQR